MPFSAGAENNYATSVFFWSHSYAKNDDPFTKTGSGQTNTRKSCEKKEWRWVRAGLEVASHPRAVCFQSTCSGEH